MPARRTLALTAAALAGLVLSACSTAAVGGSDEPGAAQGAKGGSAAEVTVASSIPAGATDVPIDRDLRLDAEHGTLRKVVVRSASGRLSGELATDGQSWQSKGRLQPGETYKVRGVAQDEDGHTTRYRARFATQALSLDEQTYPSFVPLPGSTVGVGMPVIIRFDVPVTDHAAFQRHISVTSVPAQTGAFHWISDREVHWRPESYWKPGTKVTVDADVDSVPAGNGVYGQVSRTSTFTVGRSMVSRVNMKTHQMKVFENGTLIRTIPITTGEQPKFTTRSGTKVIIEKFRRHDMNSETIGIDPNSADGYNLSGVEYAMRVTYSGEFIHAAPWSVGSQGRANVSHGCTGMSTANAGWLYEHSIVGDVVEYVGTDREMTLTNGYGDWNLSFRKYARGSA